MTALRTAPRSRTEPFDPSTAFSYGERHSFPQELLIKTENMENCVVAQHCLTDWNLIARLLRQYLPKGVFKLGHSVAKQGVGH